MNWLKKFVARRKFDLEDIINEFKLRQLKRKGELLMWEVPIYFYEFEKFGTKKIIPEQEEEYLISDLFVGAAFYPKKFSILQGEIGFDLQTNKRIIVVD